MRRPYGSGQIYEKSGAYYGRWRMPDGRRVNRKLGPVRTRGEADGLTRAEAEQAFRRIQAEEATRKPVDPVVEILTVDQAADRLRERVAIEGARLSYRQNCESMQRVHISPALGKRKVSAVTTEEVERLASRMLARGSSPKTVRNVMTFLHSVFGVAVKKGWAPSNPVEDAARPKRRRSGDADPDLQFLTPAELDRVLAVIPDHTVDRDALGPVVRLLVLMAGTTGLRQSELLGLRWRDVDMRAQRVRVRNAWVRYEHSGAGRPELSTKRSVPLTDRLVGELKRWRLRTVYGDDEDLVLAHPELGVPLDRRDARRTCAGGNARRSWRCSARRRGASPGRQTWISRSAWGLL
jgi:integrase